MHVRAEPLRHGSGAEHTTAAALVEVALLTGSDAVGTFLEWKTTRSKPPRQRKIWTKRGMAAR